MAWLLLTVFTQIYSRKGREHRGKIKTHSFGTERSLNLVKAEVKPGANEAMNEIYSCEGEGALKAPFIKSSREQRGKVTSSEEGWPAGEVFSWVWSQRHTEATTATVVLRGGWMAPQGSSR